MGSPANSGGLDPGRVAEIIVTPHSGTARRRGSGYRLNASAVLTAAHVVKDASAIWTRFNADQADEWTIQATPALVETSYTQLR